MSSRELAVSSDQRLLERARAGDAESFAAIYRRHNRVVLAFLGRRVAEPEIAADLLAETFAALLVLVRDHDRALPPTPVAWLLTTARYLLIDSYRKHQVEAAARSQLAMHPLLLEDSDLRLIEEISAKTDILRVLAGVLTSEQLEALRARVIDGQDYPTIATELRCSESVIRKRVSRALAVLRRNQVLEVRNRG